MHEVHTPDVVLVLRAQPDNGAVFVVETFALLMAFRELQTLLSPEPLDLLVIDDPAFKPEQFGNFTIAVTAILLGQSYHCQAYSFIIIWFAGFVSLCGSRHADRSTGAPLGCIEPLAHMDHGLTQVSGLQALGFR